MPRVQVNSRWPHGDSGEMFSVLHLCAVFFFLIVGNIQCNDGEGDGFAFRYIKDFCMQCLGPGQFFRPEVLSCSGARVVAATAFAMLRTQTLPICEGMCVHHAI